MLVTWYAPALIAAALLPYLPRNARAAEGTPQERIEQLQREINNKLTQLLNDTASLKDRVDRIETANARATEMADLRTRLDTLSREMREMRDEMRSSSRLDSSLYGPPSTSRFGPSAPNVPTIPAPDTGESVVPGTGWATFQVINDYPFTQQVVVNGKSYLVAPGQNRRIAIPAGEFQYQVVGTDLAPRVRSVQAGVIHMARIHP